MKGIYGVQFQDGRRAKDSEWMLGFNETVGCGDECVSVWSCLENGFTV